jgi:multiple sugar transport system substrate-binding protein
VQRRLLGLTALGVTSVMAMSALSACGNTNPLSGDVTLHFVAADYGDKSTGNSSITYWNDLVSAFEQKNPHIKIDVDVQSWDNVDDNVAKMVKQGKAPDIAQIGSYAAYAAQNQLYSADELFTVSEQADFIPSLVTAGSVDRVQYGIPWVSSSRMFFYNKKLFRNAGITQAPTQWSDIEKDAKLLKAAGVKVPYGLPLGPEESQAEALMWMLGDDGGYTNPAGGYTLDSAENVDALTWVKQNLVDKGLVQATVPGKTNRADIFTDFLSGKAGMVMGHPTLLTQAEAAHLDVGVVPLPGKDGPSTNTLGVADWMMAFKQNGNKAADGKFLQYVYQEQNSVKFLDEYGLLPVTTSASQLMLATPKDKDLVQFLKLLPDAVFYPVDKTSWGPVSSAVKQQIGQAVVGDPKTVLAKLQNYAEAQDTASTKTPSS